VLLFTLRLVPSWEQPSTIAPCGHCGEETVWLKTAYGGWGLFDAEMAPTTESHEGNRFAIDRRTRLVVDLDCTREKRWPSSCLRLHKFSCPETYDEARFYPRRARQQAQVELDDFWDRLMRVGTAPQRKTS
jgi:hypothetical protein